MDLRDFRKKRPRRRDGAAPAGQPLSPEMKARIDQILRDGHMTHDEIAAACSVTLSYVERRAFVVAERQRLRREARELGGYTPSQGQSPPPPVWEVKRRPVTKTMTVLPYKCPGCGRRVVLYPCQICRALAAVQKRRKLQKENRQPRTEEADRAARRRARKRRKELLRLQPDPKTEGPQSESDDS